MRFSSVSKTRLARVARNGGLSCVHAATVGRTTIRQPLQQARLAPVIKVGPDPRIHGDAGRVPGDGADPLLNELLFCRVDALGSMERDRRNRGSAMTPARPSPRCSHHVRMRRTRCGSGGEDAERRRVSPAQPPCEPALPMRRSPHGATAIRGAFAAAARRARHRSLPEMRRSA